MKFSDDIPEPRWTSVVLLLVPIGCWLIIDPTGRWLSNSVSHVFSVAVVAVIAWLKWLWAGFCCLFSIALRRFLRRLLARILRICWEYLLNEGEQPGRRPSSACHTEPENKSEKVCPLE